MREEQSSLAEDAQPLTGAAGGHFKSSRLTRARLRGPTDGGGAAKLPRSGKITLRVNNKLPVVSSSGHT